MHIKQKTLHNKVIDYALKKGVLKFSPQSEEEYSIENPDGSILKRKGFSSIDIYGFWMPESLSEYVSSNLSAIKENYEELGLINSFSVMNVSLPWHDWVWVVESMDSLKYDIVEDKRRVSNKIESTKILKNYEKIINDVTVDQIKEKLNDSYKQISPHIWVNKKDPTCIVYDQNFKPYAFSHGWSIEQLSEILEEWFLISTGKEIKAVFVDKNSW